MWYDQNSELNIVDCNVNTALVKFLWMEVNFSIVPLYRTASRRKCQERRWGRKKTHRQNFMQQCVCKIKHACSLKHRSNATPVNDTHIHTVAWLLTEYTHHWNHYYTHEFCVCAYSYHPVYRSSVYIGCLLPKVQLKNI